jgi:hypothetical protein
MPYKTGTADGFSGATGLLAELVDWITGTPATPGLDWEIELDSGVSYPRGIVLSNTGLSGTEHVVIGIEEYDIGWNLNCYPVWVTGMTWYSNATWRGASAIPQMPLMNAEMQYWFFSNAQRIIVVVRTSTMYQCCYLGFGNRLGAPSEYPVPVMALGCGSANLVYSDQVAGHRWFLNPPAFLFNTPQGQNLTPLWIPGAGTYNGFNSLPAGLIVGTLSTLLSPCYAAISALGTLLTLDGVRYVVNPNLQAEDQFTQDTKWLVVQNIHRLTTYDFMAINTEITVTTTSTTTTTTTSSSSSSSTTTAP